jgi:hypothetical protein
MSWPARITAAIIQAALAAAALLVLDNGGLAAVFIVGTVLAIAFGGVRREDKTTRSYMQRSAWAFIAVGSGFLVWSGLLSVGLIPGSRPAAAIGFVAGGGFIELGRRIRRAMPPLEPAARVGGRDRE